MGERTTRDARTEMQSGEKMQIQMPSGEKRGRGEEGKVFHKDAHDGETVVGASSHGM